MFENKGERNRGGREGRREGEGGRGRERGREKDIKFNLMLFYCVIYVLPYTVYK